MEFVVPGLLIFTLLFFTTDIFASSKSIQKSVSKETMETLKVIGDIASRRGGLK